MNIVFFGTSDFAIPSLESLIDSKHKVLAVVTQPDRKKGRSLKVLPTPVKAVAAAERIPVYQPADASAPESAAYLKALKPDLFVVISFGQMLAKDMLGIPSIFSVNVHGSLLPKYRGAAPTNWAVMNGDRTTGVTVIRLNERMDEGDIILKEEAPIGCDDTNVTITERLSKLGASALMKAVDMMALKGSATPLEKQDGRFATYAPKLKKKDGLIDWKESAVKIHNKVRGLLPWPGAYTHYGAMTIKVLKSEMVDVSADGAVPGEVVRASPAEGIVVKAGSGAVSIRYLKPEGKREMDSGSFLLGHELKKGYRFK